LRRMAHPQVTRPQHHILTDKIASCIASPIFLFVYRLKFFLWIRNQNDPIKLPVN
jgi:uncharacterized membrane protein